MLKINSYSLFSQGSQINQAACDLAREVADEGNALVLGGVCQTPSYLSGKGKEEVQKEFEKQAQVFKDNKVDFLLAEVSFYFILYNIVIFETQLSRFR